MASLALLVSIMFLVVLISGPLCLILARVNCIPNTIIYLISLLTISVGVWFILLPIPAIKYVGLIPIYCGYKSFNRRYNAIIRNNNT